MCRNVWSRLPFPTGGTTVLTRVGVADDGAIYACNFGTLSDSNPLKIYRWASETALPTMAYQGNPVSGIVGNQQWGKNMIVRGAGLNTQILMDTRTSILALFTTVDGENFTPTLIRSDAFDDVTVGMTWGDGDTFWGKSAEEALYQWNFDSAGQTAMVQRAKLDFPGGTFSNFDFSQDRRYLAGLVIQSGADAVESYDVSRPDADPVLLDSAAFAGNVACLQAGDGKVVWQRSLGADFKGRSPMWSFVSRLLLMATK